MEWSWLGNLTKPFANILNPVTERIGKWLGGRKPRLFVHFHPTQLIWSIGKEGMGDDVLETMHIHAMADVNHDDDNQTLLIVNVYPEGTENRIPGMSQFKVAPKQILGLSLMSFAQPVLGTKGQPWIGRLILVDQFDRKYKTKKAAFRWTGPPKPSVPPTSQ
jgi:hypothetical protein